MKKERLLSSNVDDYPSSKKHSSPSDENDGDQSPPPPKSRKTSQGMCCTVANRTFCLLHRLYTASKFQIRHKLILLNNYYHFIFLLFILVKI